MKYTVRQIHEYANRLFNILIRAGAVRVRLGELRDAAASLDSVLNIDHETQRAFSRVGNEVNQLSVFLCNVGTGLEQQGRQDFHPEMNQLALDHLSRWTNYLNGLADALNSGTGDEWVNQNPPPPGQPAIPRQ